MVNLPQPTTKQTLDQSGTSLVAHSRTRQHRKKRLYSKRLSSWALVLRPMINAAACTYHMNDAMFMNLRTAAALYSSPPSMTKDTQQSHTRHMRPVGEVLCSKKSDKVSPTKT
ncbi:unnamed protein product, partial [Ectocarpus sp. 12 AP-2014]